MSEKVTAQCPPKKHYTRDCRGRFIKKCKKTASDIEYGTERMYIGTPTHLYVQIACKETNFKKAWRKYGVEQFKTKAGLSLLPCLKTWKVLVRGYFLRREIIDGPGIYWKDITSAKDIVVEYHGNGKLLPYAEVVALRQSSKNPLHVNTDYSEYNVGLANIGVNNIGIRNLGYYNKGVEVAGLFNTDSTCFYMFNKPCNAGITTYEMYKLVPGFLRDTVNFLDFPKGTKYESPLEAFEKHKADPDWPEQYKQLIALPNFDFDIFEEITGISKKMLDAANKEWKKKAK